MCARERFPLQPDDGPTSAQRLAIAERMAEEREPGPPPMPREPRAVDHESLRRALRAIERQWGPR